MYKNRVFRTRAATISGALLLAVLAGCRPESVSPPPGSELARGTWGGESASVVVGDTSAHVHIGCTFGYFPAPAPLDRSGRFSVGGSYTLRAYPVVIGPSLPARYNGILQGGKLTLTVIVDDTVEKKTVTVGPAVVQFNREPRMGPCPICRPVSIARPG